MDRREFMACSLMASAGSALPVLARAMPLTAEALWLVTDSRRGNAVATALRRQRLSVERVADDAASLWYDAVAPALAQGRMVCGVSTQNLAPVLRLLAHLRGRAIATPALLRSMLDTGLHQWGLSPWSADRAVQQNHV